MAIWLKELPIIAVWQLSQWIPMNTTYGSNWPTMRNSYVNGASWHTTFPPHASQDQAGLLSRLVHRR